MNYREQTELYLRAIHTWGAGSQMNMTVEECAELVQAAMKLTRCHPHDEEAIREAQANIADEVADVIVMMGQMRQLFGEQAIDQRVQIKLARIKDLLDCHDRCSHNDNGKRQHVLGCPLAPIKRGTP